MKMSNNWFNLTIPVVMVCAGRFARHKPRQALRAGIAGQANVRLTLRAEELL